MKLLDDNFVCGNHAFSGCPDKENPFKANGINCKVSKFQNNKINHNAND